MHNFKRRAEQALAVFFCLTVFCSILLTRQPSADAIAGTEETEIRTTVETVLRSYQEEAMLYEERDLLPGTVADPTLVLPEEAEARSFHVASEDVTLAQLRENFIFLKKKAAFYAAMRQIQGIYRENLHLTYQFEALELTDEDTGYASVKEIAEFCYTDSDRPTVYETSYTVRLVKPDERWLVADVTDGSRFDTLYKSQGAAFDEGAALAEFAANLERDGCTISFPYTPSDAGGQILYNGANAAAYAYTYARPNAEAARSEFYNAQFINYAGRGGDCMNFASQCMWAGFGGSQTTSAINGHALPMDAYGDSQWYGRAVGKDTINLSWISCQTFRKYLTGSTDGVGHSGSNDAGDAGMYATILDVAAGSALPGVTPEELVGATAHVEGSGGNYSHAIVLTAATGTKRSEIWFCGHTKDVTHVKLGDYYIWPMKVYIPRYLRTGGTTLNPVETDRLQPVAAGSAGLLTARTSGTQYQITITVTPPGGAAERAAAVMHTDSCQGEYIFSEPGLYQVVCGAKESEDANWSLTTYYVRCYAPAVSEETADQTENVTEEWAEGLVEQPADIMHEIPDQILPEES